MTDPDHQLEAPGWVFLVLIWTVCLLAGLLLVLLVIDNAR